MKGHLTLYSEKYRNSCNKLVYSVNSHLGLFLYTCGLPMVSGKQKTLILSSSIGFVSGDYAIYSHASMSVKLITEKLITERPFVRSWSSYKGPVRGFHKCV